LKTESIDCNRTQPAHCDKGRSCGRYALLDPDPSIAYGLAVIDIGAPSIFGFSFGTPIVPVATPNVMSASLGGSVTDSTGDGVSIIPTGPTLQESEVGFPLTNMGLDMGAAFVAGPGPPLTAYAYGPYSVPSTPGPGPGPWTFLTVAAGLAASGVATPAARPVTRAAR
jgi:hypothetical protein